MTTTRYFVTYTGIKLPFNLTGELQEHEVKNRNTWFKGYFNAEGHLTGFDKIAYGDIELRHRYKYHDNGALKQAEITDIDGEVTTLVFDEAPEST